MGMGLDRATSRSDRPLAVLLLCELEKANDQAHRTQTTFASYSISLDIV
jgi:hypothetical protein